MRRVDADHMKSRLKDPKSEAEKIIFDGITALIDSEPTLTGKDNDIQWLKTKRERSTKDCHAVSYGVECSRCRKFQTYETRFCGDCGGYYDGKLPVLNVYAERKMKGTKLWHS